MKILTSAATLTCKHLTGLVHPRNLQDFVSIDGDLVLILHDTDVVGITGCANVGFTIKPCTFTGLAETGWSSLVSINGFPVLLNIITGLTDGTPPGVVKYEVGYPGQTFVSSEE